MLLLDMMRNKKREENERKKVRPGIRDKRLSINPNYETLAKDGKYTEELLARKFFQEARIREMALEQKKKKEAERGIQVMCT